MFRMLLGFTLGLLAGIVMYVLVIPDGTVINKPFLVCHLLGSGIVGLVGYGGAIVYDIENWSLGRATFTHYLVSFMTLFVISELLGWFSHDILLGMFIFFTAVYALIWLTEYYVWRSQVRKMNKDLEIMLKSHDKETE
ncbi:MAG: DUF3021 domain-containing protein [Butyrivibrio sp.]|nr:DUF3021 domain-containing protein [Butyrivibrio sp.]